MKLSGSFYWRQTAKSPKFLWFLDFSASAGFLVFALHMRAWTFWSALVLTVVLSVMTYLGFSVGMLFSRVLFLAAGKTRPPRDWSYWDQIDENP